MKSILVNIDLGIDVALAQKTRFFGELSFLGYSKKIFYKTSGGKGDVALLFQLTFWPLCLLTM